MEGGPFLVVVWGFLFCCGRVLLSNVVGCLLLEILWSCTIGLVALH